MFKGYDPDRRPPYDHVVYYITGRKIVKTVYTVSRGYADSISVTSSSSRVKEIPEGSLVEVVE